jgi:hypothetical protein
VIEAFTYSVVARAVELSLVAGVGAVGVPVNVGEASGAFKAILVLIVAMSVEFAVILAVFAVIELVFAVILAVFAFKLFVNVNSAALAVVASVVMAVAFVAIEVVLVEIAVAFAVILAVLADTFVFNVAMPFAFAVILAVFAFTLFVNVNSAALAVVASEVIAVAFVAIEAVFVEIAVAFAVILAVLAATAVGKVAIVLELTPPTELTVVTKDPFPDPVTSPVNAVVAFAAITSVPITKPKFVLAPAAVEAPVPPFRTARLPLIFAEVILLSATPAFALC